MKSCCEYHSAQLPADGSCQQGRLCPCRDKPLYAPLRHSTEDAIGYEAALPTVTDTLKPVRKPMDRQAIVLIVAAVICWGAVIAASLWPF